jgi:hypothetical protein
MKRSYIGLALGALLTLGALLSLPSCGHDQKLVSLTITPSATTYLSPTAVPAVFHAMGTYIHPPATKDITAQVTWATDVPALLTLSYESGTGEVVGPSAGAVCGIANLSATAPEGTGGSSNIVAGYATLTIDGTGPNCPGSATSGELVVTPAGTGTGTVTSSPAGISCPGTVCGSLYSAPNNVVTLTAVASENSTFTSWSGGCSGATNQCIVTVPSGNLVNVIATFTSN